nr:MAG TPA: Large Terminase [Caudoviricetes sp.]DAO12539.1 MAG TPA: Large Terminase [Caudoviricetes sp.]
MEMNRIDRRIADPRYYYDDAPVNGFVRFCETEMTLTDGGELHLLDTFKLWAEEVFGWWYYVEKSVYVPNEDGHGGHFERKRLRRRLINKQYLIVGRGAAKSLYMTLFQAYFLLIDTTTTHQVTTAPTMKLAEEVMSPFETALTKHPGPLLDFLTRGSLNNTSATNRANRPKVAATKKGIENFLTNSLLEIRPMTIHKLQSLRTKVNTIDEWLSGDIREDVVGALEQGASKVDDYLVLAVSSEGTVRNMAGDNIKMELLKILRGEYDDPHTSIFYYRLDDVKEVADPNMWAKAQPNIGITVSYDTYQRDVERAENVPHARNDILAKRFGIPLEGYTYFFTYEETLPHRKQEFWKMPCAMGVDLSQGDDFCAFTFLFPLGGQRYGVKTRCYISERTMLRLPGATRQKYEEFLEESTLQVLDGSVLDLMVVYEDLENHILENQYDVLAVGFDPYNAKEFINRWETENGPYGLEKVIQGARTESVPLGEIKAMTEDRRLIFDQSMMTFTMGNAITMEDTNGNRKLLKLRQENKIDSVSALMDAWVAYKLNKDSFE